MKYICNFFPKKYVRVFNPQPKFLFKNWCGLIFSQFPSLNTLIAWYPIPMFWLNPRFTLKDPLPSGRREKCWRRASCARAFFFFFFNYFFFWRGKKPISRIHWSESTRGINRGSVCSYRDQRTFRSNQLVSGTVPYHEV